MKWEYLGYLRTLFPYLRRYKGLGAGSIALMLVSAFTGLLDPLPLAFLVDVVLGHHQPPGFIKDTIGTNKTTLIVFAMVARVLISSIPYALSIADNYINTRLDQYIALDFQSDLYQHCQKLSQGYYDDKSGGDFIYRINSEARSAGSLLVSLPPFVQSLITLVVMFIVALGIDSELVLLSMVVVPFIYYSTSFYGKRIHPHLVRTRNLEGVLLNIVTESVRMLPVISSFNRQDYEYRRFRQRGQDAVDARLKVTLRQTLFSLGTGLIAAGGTALVLGVGAHHVLDHTLTLGELLIVMQYIQRIYGPLNGIAPAIAGFQQGFISLKFARELLDAKPEVEERPDARTIGRAHGAVAFEEVSFSYAGRGPTLEGISFDVQAGQRVAIVGPTGAGKTTLVNLIPRFREAESGRILLDGVDIRDLTLMSLRDQISIVQQQPLLFTGTIRENIQYGRLDASEEAIIAAAKAANAHDFITGLPDGYDTSLGEHGAKVSGGERQRLAVARAFMKDAPILILDEPTSSIDSRTESVILDALDRLMLGRTTFLIAHRLSTIRHADQILVVQHGRLVERGTHEELLLRGGLYRELYDLQNGLSILRERTTELDPETVTADAWP
jgi:ATP-binding cassette, subfamily B, bacterial